MKYYKNLEDMFTSAFEELGIKDGNGNPIKTTGKPLSTEEHTKIRVENITNISNRFSRTIEEHQNLIDRLNEGDFVEFYLSCNADRQLMKGIVEKKEHLGLVVNAEGKQYELKKLIDINIA